MGVRQKVVSLRQRGLKRSLQAALGILEDRWFDLRYRTDTVRWVPLTDLEITSSFAENGERYQSTRARDFRKLMEVLDIPDNSVFVDLGCGKGQTLLLACSYGFHRAVGVEFSRELCDTALRNLESYQRKTGLSVDVEIVHADAALYQIQDDQNVFYLFNPFDEDVMKGVLENIHRSVCRHPRPVWLIYNNAVCHDLILSHGMFSQLGEFFYGSSEFVVYGIDTHGAPIESGEGPPIALAWAANRQHESAG